MILETRLFRVGFAFKQALHSSIQAFTHSHIPTFPHSHRKLYITTSKKGDTLKKWVLKAIIQKTISWLPFSFKINHFFQKNVTKGVLLTEDHFGLKLKHACDHIVTYQKYRTNKENAIVLELGSGWYPVVPISLFITGFKKVISIDVSALMTKETILETINLFIDLENRKKLHFPIDQLNKKRWALLLDIKKRAATLTRNQILNELQLELIVGDARKMNMDDNRFHYICSNNTYEHIYPNILIDIIKEFKRVLKPDGLMNHFIDMTDHFAHFDKSINHYNFLRFSDKAWSRIDNSIQPQSRQRLKDYRAMYEALEIPIIEEVIWPYDKTLLKDIKLDKKWATYSADELGIIHAYLIS
jgi:SAM-dependent methyltransferase